MKCYKCSMIYDDDFDYCPYCGEKVHEPVTCPKCGFKNDPNKEVFCLKCGTDLSIDESETSSDNHNPQYYENKGSYLIDLGTYGEAIKNYDWTYTKDK